MQDNSYLLLPDVVAMIASYRYAEPWANGGVALLNHLQDPAHARNQIMVRLQRQSLSLQDLGYAANILALRLPVEDDRAIVPRWEVLLLMIVSYGPGYFDLSHC